MKRYSLSHLTDGALLRDLAVLVAQDRSTTAALLAHIAEVDARKLYLPAAYSSMFAYCVGELRMSEDQTYKRIQAARAARQFPALFDAVAEGRLHLSAVVILAAHLTDETAGPLIEAATHKSKIEIERLLAERFPAPDPPTRLAALPTPRVVPQLAPGQVGSLGFTPESGAQPVPDRVGSLELSLRTAQLAPGQVARIAPIAPQRFALQVTIDQEAYDLLRDVQDLLGHQVARGDIAEVIKGSLRVNKALLLKRKFAACAKPRKSQAVATGARHIPAEVKRKVWARDRGQCTFVSNRGKRCCSRSDLELDHIEPFARGGKATTANIRLRCRAHNQYEAERSFGSGFMEQKREAARRSSAELRHAAPEAASAVCRQPG